MILVIQYNITIYIRGVKTVYSTIMRIVGCQPKQEYVVKTQKSMHSITEDKVYFDPIYKERNKLTITFNIFISHHSSVYCLLIHY